MAALSGSSLCRIRTLTPLHSRNVHVHFRRSLSFRPICRCEKMEGGGTGYNPEPERFSLMDELLYPSEEDRKKAKQHWEEKKYWSNVENKLNKEKQKKQEVENQKKYEADLKKSSEIWDQKTKQITYWSTVLTIASAAISIASSDLFKSIWNVIQQQLTNLSVSGQAPLPSAPLAPAPLLDIIVSPMAPAPKPSLLLRIIAFLKRCWKK